MKLGSKIRSMGFGLPDMGQLRTMFDEKFNELLDELRQIRGVLEQIRDKP